MDAEFCRGMARAARQKADTYVATSSAPMKLGLLAEAVEWDLLADRLDADPLTLLGHLKDEGEG
jgi:hypothetical protein